MNIDIKTADGEEIELGGTYYDGRGTEYKAVGVKLVNYRHIANVSLSCLTGKVEELCCVSMRPNELYSSKPDNWEKLEEDLEKAWRLDLTIPRECSWYNNGRWKCGTCKAHNGAADCSRRMMHDILSRIRKLRGEDR